MSTSAETESADRRETNPRPAGARPASPAAAGPGRRKPGAPPGPDSRDAGGIPFGRYRLLEELGHGGMGVVWKAWDTHLRRHVALKQIRVRDLQEGHVLERFLREIELAARLQHPGIVRVLDAGRRDGLPYFTTELIPGKSLEERMVVLPGIPHAVRCVRAIAEALDYAHRHGVIHRDIKPGNILIDTEGRPHLLDFGLAREFLEARGGDGRRPVTTNTCAILGTPDYMSPEQAIGPSRELTPATDQFSLGVVLYHLITGRLPFAKANLRQLFLAIAEEDPVHPSRLNPRVHRDLETICLKAMEKDPERRYPTLGHLAADLGRFQDGEPILARPLSLPTRWWRKTVKHRAVVLPSVAALALGAAFLTYAASQEARVLREVRSGLIEARRLRAEDRIDEARDAYLHVLAFDKTHPEAVAGEAWARARARDREARTERDRQETAEREKSAREKERGAEDATAAAREAEREAQERAAALAAAEQNAKEQAAAALAAEEQARRERERAERLLKKPALLRLVLDRWSACGPTLAGIEAAVTAEGHSPEERRSASTEALARIQTFVDDSPLDAGSQSVARALAGWARWRAGHTEDGLRWMRQAHDLDPESPYGPLLESLAALTESLSGVPIAPPPLPESGASAGTRPPTPARRESLLDAAAEHAARTAKAPVWGEAAAAILLRAITGARALLAGRFEEAEADLTSLLGAGDLPVVPVELRLARAKARHGAGRYSSAAADLAEVAAARPKDAEVLFDLAETHLGIAAHGGLRGLDQARAYEDAIAFYDRALALRPRWPDALAQRGLALWALARNRTRLGESADLLYDKAGEALDRALEDEPASARAWLYRGLAWASRGDDARRRGWSPRAAYGRSVADFGEAVSRDSSLLFAALARAETRVRLADAEWLESGAGRSTYEGALADLDRALLEDPGRVHGHLARARARAGLGRLLDFLGQTTEARDSLVRARAELEELRKTEVANLELEESLGWTLTRLAENSIARRNSPRDDGEAAVAAFDRVLRLSPESASAFHGRGVARRILASATFDARSLEGIVEDLDRALARDPRLFDVHLDKALTLILRFEMGKPSVETWDPAMAQVDRALKEPCSSWRAQIARGLLFELRGRFADAAGAYAEAAQTCGDAVPRLVRMTAGARAREEAARRGIRPTRLIAMIRGARAMARDDHSMASSHYHEADVGKSDLERQVSLRPWLVSAFVHQARMYAAGQPGGVRDTSGGVLPTRSRIGFQGEFPYTKEDPDGRQRAVERSFNLLQRAVKLGYADHAALASEEDFHALRQTSRWESILQQVAELRKSLEGR